MILQQRCKIREFLQDKKSHSLVNLPDTVYTPDLNQIIRGIAELLSDQIQCRANSQDWNLFQHPQKQQPYQDLPKCKIISFLKVDYNNQELDYYKLINPNSLICSLIYIFKLIKFSNLHINSSNFPTILITCIMIAQKCYQDKFLSNSAFAGIVEWFSIELLNKGQLMIVKCLNFIVTIKPSLFFYYYFTIRQMRYNGRIRMQVRRPTKFFKRKRESPLKSKLVQKLRRSTQHFHI